MVLFQVSIEIGEREKKMLIIGAIVLLAVVALVLLVSYIGYHAYGLNSKMSFRECFLQIFIV